MTDNINKISQNVYYAIADTCIIASQFRRASSPPNDHEHPAHVPVLPVLARRLRVCVVARDAGALHDARLGVAHDALSVDLGEFVGRLLPLAEAQAHEGLQ